MMSQPIAYALVAMVCYGVCDFIYKQAATAGIRADHFLMVQAWFFCSLVILYALATGTIVLDPAALWGMLAGVLAFVGLYYFIRSLAAGAVSTNASIFRLNFIVTVALVVVLLGEPLTLRKITGLAFALLATWLLLGTAGPAADRTSRDARRRSLLQVAVATLAFGAANSHRWAAPWRRPGNAGSRPGGGVHAARDHRGLWGRPQAAAGGNDLQLQRHRRDPAARRHHFHVAQRGGRAGERAGADHADGIHRRRAAWHFRSARAHHGTQDGRPGLGIGGAGRAGRKLSAVRSRRAQPTIAARQLRSRLPAACKSVDRRASARYFTSLLA
jgi:transporter family protein